MTTVNTAVTTAGGPAAQSGTGTGAGTGQAAVSPNINIPPGGRSILNASEEEYNKTVVWIKQMFANDSLSASETGKNKNT